LALLKPEGRNLLNETPVPGELLNRFLEGSHSAAAKAADVDEVVPNGLAFVGLARLLKAMAQWRISFHDSGMGGGYYSPRAQRQGSPSARVRARIALTMRAPTAHHTAIL
jgi:hypothetical protein